MERVILRATQGKVLTDGKTYGRTIYLARGMDGSNFYEITEEEYSEIIKVQEEQEIK